MTSLYRISGSELVPIQRKPLQREELLEGWIENDPLLIGLDVLVIGRQVVTEHNGRIDLLAIDREGNLTIIELKRDRTPRDVVAQILDYASWVSTLSPKQISDIATGKLGKKLEEVFYEHFDVPLPETLNSDHSMVIVASEFDASSKRIVEYLAREHDISINTAFANVFDDNGHEFLATDWLMDQQEVVERSESKKKLPWSGYWYVNVGEGPHRSWDDMRRYGFLAAGGGRFYSSRLEQLNVGDTIFGYQKKAGYVGRGMVTSTAKMARDFEIDGVPLLSKSLKQSDLGGVDKFEPVTG